MKTGFVMASIHEMRWVFQTAVTPTSRNINNNYFISQKRPFFQRTPGNMFTDHRLKWEQFMFFQL